MDKEEILKILKQKKELFPIKQFILFGSFANGSNTTKSDVDIAYILKDGFRLSFDKYLELESELSSYFKTNIDLINYKKLNPLVKLNAKKDFIYV